MIGRGKPTVEGTYTAEVYFGWKILEYRDGAWWHPSKVGRWMAEDPYQWVGPLPEFVGKRPMVGRYDL